MKLATKCLMRCKRCGATLGLSLFARRHVWCPKCQALLRPEAFMLGPKPGVIVHDEALREHPQLLAKLVWALAYNALSSGSDRFILTFQNGEYSLVADIENRRIPLKPPPSELSIWLPDVVRAVAGIPRTLADTCVTADVTIVVSDASPQEWLMQVEIAYFDEGHRIIFEFPSMRETDLDVLPMLIEATA